MATKSTTIIRHASRCLSSESRIPSILSRQMATDAHPRQPLTFDTPETTSNELIRPHQHRPPKNPFLVSAQCTIHSFPQLEPLSFETYPSTHLLLPLRRDILHRAVTFEADASRQGTANTKWRGDVNGSGRKLRPQKGSGKARLGDRKSPMLRGGGVAHGPKPRDFSTALPAKMYDLAFRTALSYRYRRGQLIVLDSLNNMEDVHSASRARYLKDMLRWHKMGHPDGRTLIISEGDYPALTEAFQDKDLNWEAEYCDWKLVDVKDLLELGRVVVEKRALAQLFRHHQKDLWLPNRIENFVRSSRGRESPTLVVK